MGIYRRVLNQNRNDNTVDLETHIRTACLMECTAPKLGNVTPTHSFEDLTHDHFVTSSSITAKWISRAPRLGVGYVIEQAAREIMDQVGQNTHLGILLLLAPLAAARDRDDLPRVLESLTMTDAKQAYNAIRVMEPGGLGQADKQDVHDEPTETLLECMRLAADRDTIARQYANGFADVFRLTDAMDTALIQARWTSAIRLLQLELLAAMPDTLIARKCGEEVANEASQRAARVLQSSSDEYAAEDFDRWLRADGHRRNPGTTADMITALLFLALRERRIGIPTELRTL